MAHVILTITQSQGDFDMIVYRRAKTTLKKHLILLQFMGRALTTALRT